MRYGLDPYVTIRFVSKGSNCDFIITILYFGLVLLLKIVSSFLSIISPPFGVPHERPKHVAGYCI